MAQILVVDDEIGIRELLAEIRRHRDVLQATGAFAARPTMHPRRRAG